MKTTFLISSFIVFYTYIGYGIALYFLTKIVRKKDIPAKENALLPTCTVVVAAYNEAGCIKEKILNTLQLIYPEELIKYVFVTDGSTDNTPAIVCNFPLIHLLHQSERNGKIAAVHRAMEVITTDVVVFTDANTFLNPTALLEICKHYCIPEIGAVAGEKRVKIDTSADATVGEGFYWKYESKLKKLDSELYSVVGAAGELFSIRKILYQPVPKDSILDDFMISMRIAEQNYRIIYEPKAYAMETGSANVKEELKRKIRISAGGIQSIIYLKKLLNIFRNPVLSFQYISHRVLRWTITPFALMLSLILNVLIIIYDKNPFYLVTGLFQLFFYALALAGWMFESRQIRIKILFVPYYFCMMNYAVIAGLFRYFNNGQSAVWQKAERKNI